MTRIPEIVSFGGGVQSTALALLCIDRDSRLLKVIPRLPDVFLFADTGNEPQAVYRHIAVWRGELARHGFRFVEVRRGAESLQQHVESKMAARESGISMPPVFVPRRTRPGRMPVRRGCTRDFKVKPMDAWVRKEYPGRGKVGRWLGISYDEIQRSKADHSRWVFRHPLVDMRWRRTDCIQYLRAKGIEAPRSACTFCPFRSNAQWRALTPGEFAAAVEFEQKMRAHHAAAGHIAGLEGDPTLHQSGLLENANLEEHPLLFGWDDECAGVCGV